MNDRKYKIAGSITILILVSLACMIPGMEEPPSQAVPPASEIQVTEGAEPVADPQTAAEPQETPCQSTSGCAWVLQKEETVKALATGGGDPLMDAYYSFNEPLFFHSIKTFYQFAGNAGCSEQFVTTNHIIPDIGVLVPGEAQTVEVRFEWSLDGDPACTALTMDGLTSYTIGSTVISASQDKITLSVSPNGYVTSSGSFIVPEGKPGDRLTVTEHGSAGSLGGNVFLKYAYKCGE